MIITINIKDVAKHLKNDSFELQMMINATETHLS